MSEIQNKVVTATKWSAFAEILAKLITPITTMVLARLLTPDAFGVVTTIAMVVTFAEIFTDAGFQRYIIQHEFADDTEQDQATNVAFWSNLIMSLLIWGIIAIFAEPLAKLVGNHGLGNVLIIACVSIPLAAFSSIQMAVFKRSLNFKSLFYLRLVSIFVPLCITVPLAFWLKSYWALVFGTITVNLSNAIILTAMSPWKPRLYYCWKQLVNMFSFSMWSVLDSILVWCTNYIEIFLIGRMLSTYYLGIYKTSITTVTQLTGLITASVLPILMPAFARTQNDFPAMRKLIFDMQKYLSILLLPLGFGIFVFSGLITNILLGDQWNEAIPYIGIWALVDVFIIVFSRFCSNIFPAIGKPKISVYAQILHLIVLLPAVYISIGYGFEALFYTRTFVRLEGLLVGIIFAYYTIKISPIKMLTNIVPELIACIIMSAVGYILLAINDNLWLQFLWITICAIIYLMSLTLFAKDRQCLVSLYKKISSQIKIR